MGRVMVDFRTRFPGFYRRGQMKGSLRKLYAEVERAERTGMLDSIAGTQLELF